MNQNSNGLNSSNIGQKCLCIMVFFCNDYAVKLSASDISKRSSMNRRTISRILSNMVDINLLRYEIDGKNKKYYLDLKNFRVELLILMIEQFKSLNFSYKYAKIGILLEDIISLREIVLFGSYSSGNATSMSDIDILIIGKESVKIRNLVRKGSKQINIHFSSIAEFRALLNKKNTLAMEIVKNHIVFGGIEFVKMCHTWYKK